MPIAQFPIERVLTIRPTLGMWVTPAAEKIPLDASPDMLNCSIYGGLLRKRPGFALFPDTMTALAVDGVTGIFSCQDESNTTHAYATTALDLFKYNGTDWIACTGTLSGSAFDRFTWAVSQNTVLFCQGVDPVQRVPFSTTYADLDANAPPAKYLERFANRIHIAYTNEGGGARPFRIRRPVAADHTNWTGVGSGFVDMAEHPYHLKNIRKLGPLLAVYTERSILLATRTSNPAAPAAYEPAVEDQGLLAPHSLQARSDVHLFLGLDDFYSYTGGKPQNIAPMIRDLVFGTLNAGALDVFFSTIRYDSQEYICFIATGGAETPNLAWVYHWPMGVWHPWSVSGPLCATSHRLDNTQTWDSIPGNWSEWTIPWDAQALTAAYPAMLTGHSDGLIYQWAYSTKSDAGAPIACRWTSKDITSADVDPSVGDRKLTMKALGLFFRKTGVTFTLDFSYSTDGGQTWLGPFIETFLPGDKAERWISHLQVTGNRIRFKIEQTSDSMDFQIEKFMPYIEVRAAPVY
jgi:hypothetical protein